MNFFALYLAPVSEIKKWTAMNPSPEEMKKEMDKWMKWFEDHKHILTDMGQPLGKTKRVTKDGVSDAVNEVTGYSIVEAGSHEEAVKLFEGHPHLQIPGGYIDILVVRPIPSAE